jgi:hypothetical protein
VRVTGFPTTPTIAPTPPAQRRSRFVVKSAAGVQIVVDAAMIEFEYAMLWLLMT